MKKIYEKPFIILEQLYVEQGLAVGSAILDENTYSPEVEDFLDDPTIIDGTSEL